MLQRFVGPVRRFFNTPAREAYGLAAVGIVGVMMGTIGMYLLLDDGAEPHFASTAPFEEFGPTPTTTPEPRSTSTPATVQEVSPSPSPTMSPAPPESTVAPDPTVAPVHVSQPSPTPPPPTAVPTATSVPATATPTPPPAVAGGEYCPAISSNSPPVAVLGTVTVGGEPAAAGGVVALAFDGVVGPSTTVSVTEGVAGYRIDYAAAGEGCANRAGASVSVIFGGVAYATGHVVGDGEPVVRVDIAG